MRAMEEEQIIDVERRLVGRVPFKYHLNKNARTLESDSGFGKVGAKMDPKTGALMYEKYEDWIHKQKVFREEVKETNIRFSKDSQAIIDIRERVNGSLAFDGSVIDHSSKGVVTIFNRSDRDRLWDIDVGIRSEGSEAQLDFRNYTVKELEPTRKEGREYPIDLAEPSLAVEEIISTHPDHPESLVIIPGIQNPVRMQLGIKNLDTIPYKEVIVTKAVPQELKNIIFPDQATEDVMIEGGKLRWKINDLQPGAIRILRYEGEIDTKSPNSFPTGDVYIIATSEDLTTNIVVDSFEAMCRNMYMIEADETDEPGIWICRFVIENTSQFEVEVLRVEVKDPQSDEIYVQLEDPGIYIPPGDRWESREWTVPGRERPSFIKNMVLNVVPGIYLETKVDMQKDGGAFHPASLSFSKVYDRKKVEARRETLIQADIRIESTADADLEQLFIRDVVPPFMRPPQPSNIKVSRDGINLSDNVSFDLQPSDNDPMQEQQLYLRIDDLSKNGGPLRKGDRIDIAYETEVVRPEPGSTIGGGAEVDARPYLPGPMISGKDVAGIPSIVTVQTLRKFTVGKSVEQGKSAGEYAIQLLYRNRGNVKVLDMVLKDILPENFTPAGFSVEPVKDSSPEGFTILKWHIKEIQPGESLVIDYMIKGSGEYHPKDAQIFYNDTMD
ncbi:MAG: hypothetical protein QCI82_09525 [Candidatus Thermoplasmatota archaeon]|nr:hypothetical protein [Candidatus Thermoplasmatota archaeon]